jgi:ABC transporter DrrB family efflux protein
VSAVTDAVRVAPTGNPISQSFRDSMVVAKRNLIRMSRIPEMIIYGLIQPIMFVVLFTYVFGGSMQIGGSTSATDYKNFLMAGIFAQTVIFGATITGAGLAEDVKKGIIDRFRSLPMAPSAVLTGRTISDVANNVLVLIVMSLTGLLVGWAIHSSPAEAALGYLLLLVFAYAISWIMAWLGMLVPSVEVFNNATFIVIFPLTFVANTFVPLETLPGPLQTFAEWNPVSAVTQASRELFGNIPEGVPTPDAWPLQNPIVYTLIWSAIFIVVFVPLANYQYRRSTSR